MENDGVDTSNIANRERTGLNLSIGMIVQILLSKGMSWDDVFDRTFDQANLIVSKHFELQKFYFETVSELVFGSNKTTVTPNDKHAALQGVKISPNSTGKVDVAPVKDNPYPDGFGRV